MKRFLRTLGLGIAALFLAGTVAVPAANAVETPDAGPTKAGYTLDFNEEFSGTSLDTETWLPYYLPHWASDRESSAARYTVANGLLTERIDADTPAWNPEYDTTVKVSSIQTYNANWWHRFNADMPNDHNEPTFDGYSTKYGYIEMRAKLSNTGGGGHQALWLVGTDDTSSASANPEIDMLETFFSKPDTWRIAAYNWGSPDFIPYWDGCECQTTGSPTSEFHVYGMDWSPTELKFYYDGVLVRTIADAPNQAMGIILGIYTDAGSGVHNNVWPKSWAVDYLRVFKKNGGYPEAEYKLLKNRQTGELLHIEGKTGNVQSGVVPSSYWSAQWKEEVTPSGYIRFKNRWTGDYLTLEGATGNVQYAAVTAGQWAADWTKETVDGYTRIKNRNTGGYINTEVANGIAHYGAVPATYWTSQWSLQPAPQ